MLAYVIVPPTSRKGRGKWGTPGVFTKQRRIDKGFNPFFPGVPLVTIRALEHLTKGIRPSGILAIFSAVAHGTFFIP